MAYPILTYVRTGIEELTEMGTSGNRVIDVTKIRDVIDDRKLQNTEHVSDPDWPFYDIDDYDLCIAYFEAMSIEGELPDDPPFDARVVSMCGILAAMG
jgi:hypothetical protein